MSNYKFLFTIISAVYNSGKFLNEFVDSIINQTIGFDNIQLILVNDGSSDNSLEICNSYKERYPENIIVVDKENGGVSSARNAGLEFIEGKYLNFIDSDDKFSLDTLEKVYNFFEKNYAYTDVVSIPFEYFDGVVGGGDHIQNRKFANGSRIVNLEKEYKVSIMNVTFSFMKSEAAKGILFDTTICIGEDLKFINTILLKQRTVGLLNDGKYYYRKHSDGSPSLISTKLLLKQYYIPQVKNLTLWAHDYAIENYGCYPLFLQYTIASDFQDKIRPNPRAKSVLGDELNEYRRLMNLAFKTFDDEIITSLELISKEYKVFWLYKKYGKYPSVVSNNNFLKYEIDCLDYLDEEGLPYKKTSIDWYGYTVFDKIRITKRSLDISGYVTILPFDDKLDDLKIFVKAYNALFPVTILNNKDNNMFLYKEVIYYKVFYEVSIPLYENEKTDISILYSIGDNKPSCISYAGFSNYAPISNKLPEQFFARGNYLLKPTKNGVSLAFVDKKEIKKQKKKYNKALLKNHKKYYFYRKVVDFFKRFFKKRVWLISDRFDIAGDNGEALFKYAVKNAPKGVKPYFVISASSRDYKRMKSIGSVIKQGSAKHKIFYLLSDVNISAHLDYETLMPVQYEFFRDMICDKKVVFLQHGVTKDDIHTVYSRYKQNTSLFICASDKERESIVNNDGYGFKENQVKTTGFARFDYLKNDEQKIITIMPTWRKYLVRGLGYDGKWIYISKIEDTDFVKFYKTLLSSKELLDRAEEYGYQIRYTPHPNVLPLTDLLDVDPRVMVDSSPVYSEIFAKSSLMITDYSSTAFDFAYMRKPIIYAHFDKKLFFNSHTYEKGYFSYENDGFGEVTYDVESTINTLIEYMKNGCVLKDIYRERVNSFFKHCDNNNCQRIVESIMEMEDYYQMIPEKREPKSRIPVVFATNEKYAPFVSVTIQSLIYNSDLRYFYDIYVFNTGLSKDAIRSLECNTLNYSVKCVDVSEFINPHLEELPENSKYITKETYYRIVIPSVLKQYDKVIYLDCDLVVLGDISEFYNTDISSYMLAGVRNPLHTAMKEHIEALDIEPQKYINAGVLLMNLQLMRENNFEEKCFNLLATRDLKFMDQDAVNLACLDSIRYLDMKWNYGWHYERLNTFRDTRYHLIETEVEEYTKASEDIKILHFTGDIKPWNNSKFRFGSLFWDYAKKSSYYKDILVNSPLSSTYRKYIDAVNEIKAIRSSLSYKVGRFMTFPLRALRWLKRKIFK